MTLPNEFVLDLTQRVSAAASPDVVWSNLIQRLTVDSATPDGQSMPLTLELRPGGRWYRDLGDQQGHLWGFVQVIKPSMLLEIQGPMFMSYAVAGHIQFRIAEQEGQTELLLRHRAVGMIQQEHREGVVPGWQTLLNDVKAKSES